MSSKSIAQLIAERLGGGEEAEELARKLVILNDMPQPIRRHICQSASNLLDVFASLTDTGVNLMSNRGTTSPEGERMDVMAELARVLPLLTIDDLAKLLATAAVLALREGKLPESERLAVMGLLRRDGFADTDEYRTLAFGWR